VAPTIVEAEVGTNGLKPFASPTGLDSTVSAVALAALAPLATAGAALNAPTATDAPTAITPATDLLLSSRFI
jgi:hypothetical protein